MISQVSIPKWACWLLIIVGSGLVIGAVGALIVDRQLLPMSCFFAAWAALLLVNGIAGIRRIEKRASLDRDGVRATAVVNAVHSTGWTVNNVPKFALTVRVASASPFDAKLDVLTFRPPDIGSVIGVLYEAARPQQHIVFDDAATASLDERKRQLPS